MADDAISELVRTLDSLDGYDGIYIGFSNYRGTMTMAVFTFWEQIDWADNAKAKIKSWI